MVELIALVLSSEGATQYESFLHRKPLDDYTPDYTVCQLDFDLVDTSQIISGRQPPPDRSVHDTIDWRLRMYQHQYAQILPPGGAGLSKFGATSRTKD